MIKYIHMYWMCKENVTFKSITSHGLMHESLHLNGTNMNIKNTLRTWLVLNFIL